jgi:hypothetical protein
MKKVFVIIWVISEIMFVISGCKKSTEEEFNAANGDIAQKYIKRLDIISNDASENKTFVVNYDSENKVSSMTDGISGHFFVYDTDNNLSSITDEGGPFNVNDLYQAPYDAFETGNVLEYDSKLNPVKIQVYENEYPSDPLIGEIIYDLNPNPFFYTLKAAKIIDVLDRVDLNFGIQSSSIIKARKLLPYNNIKGMIFKDLAGNTKYEVQVDYTYDADKYPTSADVYALSPEKSYSYSARYFYK